MSGVYLRLFHGRNEPGEQLDDWGFDGPILGPLEYVHTTYATDVKFYFKRAEDYNAQMPAAFIAKWGMSCQDAHLPVVEDCIEFDGKYYGDWSVTSAP